MRIKPLSRESDERCLFWMELHERGLTQTEIARRTGTSKSMVGRFLREVSAYLTRPPMTHSRNPNRTGGKRCETCSSKKLPPAFGLGAFFLGVMRWA